MEVLMWTVNEVSKMSGVSVRALHYYDEIGLLTPAQRTEAGYRLYNEGKMAELKEIMLFRELDFGLSEIAKLIKARNRDKSLMLRRQAELLRLKRERIDKLIALVETTVEKGEWDMDFSAFDETSLKEYARCAKERWGDTEAYREFEDKELDTDAQYKAGDELMQLFARLGAYRGCDPASPEVQARVRDIQAFITERYYTCTNEMFLSLGQMYTDGDSTGNIDAAGGEGTAELAGKAIAILCGKE